MRNTFLIAINNLKMIFRKKSSVIVFLILPVIGILVSIGAYSSIGTSALKVGISNDDSGIIAAGLVKTLDSHDDFKVTILNENEINNSVSSGKVDCALIIPEGFSKSIYDKSFKKIRIISIKDEASTAWIKNYINIYMKNLLDIAEAAGGDNAKFDKIYESYEQEKLVLKISSIADSSQSKGITSQSLGFLIFFMMLGAGITAELILKDKRNRSYFRICSTPTKIRYYLIANVFTNFIIVFVQVVIALFAITKIFKINTYIPIWELVLIMLSIGLVAIALGLMVVSFSKDSMQANTMQNLIVTPTCMLGGCYWPVSMMPENLQKIADFLPQKWALEAIQKLQSGSSFEGVLPYIAIVLAFACALFLIAAYRFTRNDSVNNVV